MAYRKIDNAFWRDDKVKNLNVETRHLFMYLLTSPHCNMIGAYYLPLPYILADLYTNDELLGNGSEGYRNPFETVSKGIDTLSQAGLITYDTVNSMVVIHNFIKYNRPDNANVIKSAIKLFLELPQTPALYKTGYYLELYAAEKNIKFENPINTPKLEPLPNGIETVSKGYRTQEQEHNRNSSTEQEQEYLYREATTVAPLHLPEIPQDDPPLDKNTELRAKAAEVVLYLNLISKRNYDAKNKTTIAPILARLRDGATVEQCKQVIDTKSKDPFFKKNPQHMKTKTLFGTKFYDYLQENPAMYGGERSYEEENEEMMRAFLAQQGASHG